MKGIAFSGKRKSGKDTLAEELLQLDPDSYRRISHADALKDACNQLANGSREWENRIDKCLNAVYNDALNDAHDAFIEFLHEDMGVTEVDEAAAWDFVSHNPSQALEYLQRSTPPIRDEPYDFHLEADKDTHRDFLVSLAGHVIRGYDAMHWTRPVRRAIEELPRGVTGLVTDLRYPNEADYLSSICHLVRIDCSLEERRRRGSTPDVENDEGETSLDNYEGFLIRLDSTNTASPELLTQLLQAILVNA